MTNLTRHPLLDNMKMKRHPNTKVGTGSALPKWNGGEWLTYSWSYHIWATYEVSIQGVPEREGHTGKEVKQRFDRCRACKHTVERKA